LNTAVSGYVAADHGWRQTWLAANLAGGKPGWRQTWLSPAGFADFKGGGNGTAMVIQGVWPQPGHAAQMTRMTYTPHGDGSVEQSGQTSDDGGTTWQPSFDFIYRHPSGRR